MFYPAAYEMIISLPVLILNYHRVKLDLTLFVSGELKSLSFYFIMSEKDKVFPPLVFSLVDTTFDLGLQSTFIYQIELRLSPVFWSVCFQ